MRTVSCQIGVRLEVDDVPGAAGFESQIDDAFQNLRLVQFEHDRIFTMDSSRLTNARQEWMVQGGASGFRGVFNFFGKCSQEAALHRRGRSQRSLIGNQSRLARKSRNQSAQTPAR